MRHLSRATWIFSPIITWYLSKSTPPCNNQLRSKTIYSETDLACHKQLLLKAMINSSKASMMLISSNNLKIKFKCNKTKTIKRSNTLSKSLNSRSNSSTYNGVIHLITLEVVV